MKQEELLKNYIRVLTFSDINLLTVHGKPGFGKSYIVMETMNELGLEKNLNFLIISGHITPKRLYEILQETSTLDEPKLLIFDDLNSIIQNKTCLGLIKSALSDISGERIVSYESTREEIKSFNFCGKIILIANHIPKSKDIKPFLDRGLYISMDIEPQELIAYIERNLGDLYGDKLTIKEKKNVWGKAIRFVEYPKFSLRALNRAFALYSHNPENWYKMWVRSLK